MKPAGICLVTPLNQKRVFSFPDSSSTGSSASSKGSSVSSKGLFLSSTESAVVGEKFLYLFYQHYSFSKNYHSLYKIEIDLEIPTTMPPCPILDFPIDKYPRGMRCVRLSSKLYFLGGSRVLRDFLGEVRVMEEVLSRDVYVFDTFTNDFKKMDACLNAGKYNSIVFAANGKLYTLAQIPPDLSKSELLSLSLFECFDPITNKWRVLNNLPPVKNKCVNWMGCTVFGKRQQVVLVGVEGSTKLVKFVFHVHQEKWTRHALHSFQETFNFSETLSFQEGGHGGYLYGLRNWGPPVKSRSGVMGAFFGNDPVEGSTHMSIPGTPTTEGGKWAKWVNSFFGQLSREGTSRFLRYLGKDYFIYVASGSPDSDDFYTQEISLTLFKEQKNQEGDEKLHFQADILHSEKYKFQIQDCTAKLVASFVIAPEQLKKKLDMMVDKKKKKNKKNKKYMKNKKKKKNDNMQSFGDTIGC